MFLGRLDWYIIRKFLGTFFFSLVLILSIAIIFDITEKMDDFYEHQLTLHQIIFDYYIHFVPYYANMFSSLFIFISVIFFTSKMASNSEIIAILSSGISYHRLMRPYLVSATFLFAFAFWFAGYVIPPASSRMLDFTDRYIHNYTDENALNVQMEIEPGTILYIETFQKSTLLGYKVSLDHFEGKTLISRTTADRIRYSEEDNCWHFENYVMRTFSGMNENLTRGLQLDTVLAISPNDFFINADDAQRMTNPELKEHITKLEARGAGNVQAFLTEWHRRLATPLGVFIMTFLGVTMSSRKVRGGMGKNLGIGIALTAIYILFSTVSTTFSASGVMSPFTAAWLPNMVFLVIGIVLYLKAIK